MLSEFLHDPVVKDVLARKSSSRSARRGSSPHQRRESVTLVSTILGEEERASTQLRAALHSALDRADAETRRVNDANARADYAERRVEELEARLGKAERANTRGEDELSRVNDAVRTLRAQLEEALHRANVAEEDARGLRRRLDDSNAALDRSHDRERQLELSVHEWESREEGRESAMRHALKKEFAKGREEGYAEGEKAGFETGREEGFSDGYDQGSTASQLDSFEEGKRAGHNEGFEEGWYIGRDHARKEALNVFTTVLDEESRARSPSPTPGPSRPKWLSRRVTSGSTDRSHHRAESDAGTISSSVH